jgi:enoyl-CoA hydratase
MILRSRKVDGQEAPRIGLVHEAWPLAELKDRATALAHELAAQSAAAVRSMLGVIIGREDRSLDELMDIERKTVTSNRDTADAQEGMRAFLEKRKPTFSSRN